MPVGDGDADALRRDEGCLRRDNCTIFDAAPDAERLLLALLFFPADVGDHVINHFRPLAEGLPRPGNRLIGRRHDLGDAEAQQRRQRRHIGLNRAVGFDGDEATARAEPFFLRLDDGKMRVVHLGDYHGDVGRPAVRGIV